MFELSKQFVEENKVYIKEQELEQSAIMHFINLYDYSFLAKNELNAVIEVRK